MPQILSDNLETLAPKVLDNKNGRFSAGKWRPYNNVAEYEAAYHILASRAETQMIWVRSEIDGNKADLYVIGLDKAPYKVISGTDITELLSQIESISDALDSEIETRESADATNAAAVATETNRATQAESAIQSQVSSKANAADIVAPITIAFSDLVSNTYTNILFANQKASLTYYDVNGLQQIPEIQFNASGVITLPFTADSNFRGRLDGVSGVLGNYALKSDLNYKGTYATVDAALIANPYGTRKLGDSFGVLVNSRVVKYWFKTTLYQPVPFLNEAENIRMAFIPGVYYKNNTGPVSNIPITLANFSGSFISVLPGDVWNVKGAGGQTPRLWAITNLEGALLSSAAINAATGSNYVTLQITEPGYLYVNVETAVANDTYKSRIGFADTATKAEVSYRGTYATMDLALAGITLASRRIGDAFGITTTKGVVEYWFKSSVQQPEPKLDEASDIRPVFLDGGYYKNNANPVVSTPTALANISRTFIGVVPGDIWNVKGSGGQTPRLWSFSKADGTLISNAAANVVTGSDYLQLTVPADAVFLHVNAVTDISHDVYKTSLATEVSKVSTKVSSVSKSSTAVIKYDANDTEKGFYYRSPTTEPNIGNKIANQLYENLVLDVVPGDYFVIKVTGGATPTGWVITDNTGLILQRVPPVLNTKREFQTVSVTAPTASKIYINNAIDIDQPFFAIKYASENLRSMAIALRSDITIKIAAFDSPDRCKREADLVCPGVDDGPLIEDYLDRIPKGGTILFSPGTFRVASFRARTDADATPTAIFSKRVNHRFLTLTGEVRPQFYIGVEGATIFEVTQACYDALDDNTPVSVFRGQSDPDGFSYFNSQEMNNIVMRTPGNQKPITLFDWRYFTTGGLNGVYGYADDVRTNIYFGSGRPPVPNVLSRGWVGFLGSNSAYYTKLKETIFQGFHEGFKMGGDHMISDSCATTRCTYGLTVGTINPGSRSDGLHPMTFIKYVDETNTNLPYFGQYFAGRQAVCFTAMNIENQPGRAPAAGGKYMQEHTPGSFFGSVEWSSQADLNGSHQIWENDGSGKGFRTKNLRHAEGGTTAIRAVYYPSLFQRYVDLDLKMDLHWNGTRWNKSDGSSATAKVIGTTVQRPVFADIYSGYKYYDTTINKAINCISSGLWVDGNGVTV